MATSQTGNPLMRTSHLGIGRVLLSGVLIAMLGCSDESGKGDISSDSTSSSTGGTTTSGDGDISLESTGGGQTEDSQPERPRDGGRIDLTEEETEEISTAACAGWEAEGERLPAILQLVVDVSGSMEWPAPGTNQSKWEVTRVALEQAIDEMPASVSIGLLFYPNVGMVYQTPSPCVRTSEAIPIDFLGDEMSSHRQMISQSFESAQTGWATPTYDAYNYALNNLLVPYDSILQKFMLLITDGAPTVDQECVVMGSGDEDAPTDPIVGLIEGAFNEHQIRTFLIGSPGSEESSEGMGDMRPWLSSAAVLGGTAPSDCEQAGPNFCHMDMTQEPDFAEALREGLKEITGQILDSCKFQVPEPPPGETIDPHLTNLIVTWGDGTSSLILADEVADCTDGWTFNDAGEVELCGLTCDEVKLDPSATVSLTFGCDTDELVVR